jgi:hypothetical protein
MEMQTAASTRISKININLRFGQSLDIKPLSLEYATYLAHSSLLLLQFQWFVAPLEI